MMARKEDTAFWQSKYKNKITNIVFKKGEISSISNYIESFDVRGDENCAEIKAYLEDDGTGNSTYKLTILSPHTIYINPNSYQYFKDFTGLKTIDFANIDTLDTSKTIVMQQMFSNCSSLQSLNCTHFNTANVKTMSSMFYGCSTLTSLNLSSFNTNKVTNMNSMFNECRNLSDLSILSFDTSNVINMQWMFRLCTGL